MPRQNWKQRTQRMIRSAYGLTFAEHGEYAMSAFMPGRGRPVFFVRQPDGTIICLCDDPADRDDIFRVISRETGLAIDTRQGDWDGGGFSFMYR